MLENQISEYIDNLLNPDFYCSDKNVRNKNIDVDAVFCKVVSSKFRKTKIDLETECNIKNKIIYAINNKEPLKFSVPFGAYKSWKLNLNFQPDWAEVFNMSFLMKYAHEIISVFPYGVELYYTFSDEIMYFVSDIPREDTINYVVSFEKLINLFNEVSDEIRFKLVRINDLYSSPEEYYIDFLERFLDNLMFWEDKYDVSVRNRHIKSAKNNLYVKGKRNLIDQSVENCEKYYYYSALMTDAVDCISKRRYFNKEGDKIQLVCVKGPRKSINIGGCETSCVHFWVSKGCLKLCKGEIKPFLYTHSQMDKLYNNNYCVEYLIKSRFKDISENFNKITFIEEKFI